MFYLIEDFAKSLQGIQLFAVIFAYFLALIVALTFHEFAHAFAAHKAGDNTPKVQGRLTLNPLKHISGFGMVMFLVLGFGWAKPVEINPTKFRNYKRSMTIVSMAGIFVNIVLAILSAMIFAFMNLWGGAITNNLHLFLRYFFEFSCILNVMLAVFNFLPVFPLDGFKLLAVWLKPDNKFLIFMAKYGYIMLLVFLLTPIYDIIFGLVVLFVQTIGWAIPALFI